jgi:YVTN family beta-propeller protein
MRVTHRFYGAAVLSLALAAGGPGARAQGPEGRPEGRLLVANGRDNTLMVFEVPSHRRVAVIPVGEGPTEVAVAPGGRKAYVANTRAGSVSIVDLAALKVARTLRSNNLDAPGGLDLSPDGRRLLLSSDGNRRLFMIDALRDTVLRSVTTTQKGVGTVAFAPDGKRALVSNPLSDSLTVVRAPDLRIARHVRMGDTPTGLAATPNGRFVLAALEKADQVAILDASSLQVLARLPAGRAPARVAVTPNGFTAAVANRGSDDLTLIDLLARRVKSTVRVGRRPGGLAMHPGGTRVYVANSGGDSVSVVSITGGEVAATIPVGAEPRGIAFVPAASPAPAAKGRRP